MFNKQSEKKVPSKKPPNLNLQMVSQGYTAKRMKLVSLEC